MGCPCLICADLPAGRDEFIVNTIHEHGWCVLRIDGEPEFAYTVGLWHTFRRPELAMFGLGGQGMQHWLNACVGTGQVEENVPFGGVIDGFDTMLRKVHADWHDTFFGTATRVYQGVRVPVRQLIWPDKLGNWPWDDEAGEGCRTSQAQAWLPVAEHPHNSWREEATA